MEEKEVRLRTLNQSLSISINKSKNISFAEEHKDLTGIQKLVKIFNYDRFETEGSDLFRDNSFLSPLVCELIYEIATEVLPFNRIVEEIHRIFT